MADPVRGYVPVWAWITMIVAALVLGIWLGYVWGNGDTYPVDPKPCGQECIENYNERRNNCSSAWEIVKPDDPEKAEKYQEYTDCLALAESHRTDCLKACIGLP